MRGYTMPVRTVNTSIMARAGSSWRRMSGHSQCSDEQIDELDEDERGDDASDPVDHQVSPQHRRGLLSAELHTSQRERDQGDDDQRVEDDGGEDRRTWCVQ